VTEGHQVLKSYKEHRVNSPVLKLNYRTRGRGCLIILESNPTTRERHLFCLLQNSI